ncbi:MAG: polyprenyl synthetase family protein [Elusimicrobiota bacterium]
MENFLLAVKDEISSSFEVIDEKYFDFKKNFYEPLGKAIRSRFAFHLLNALKADWKKSVSIAASAEIVHLASLMHDDCIDGASKRRGFDTLNFSFGINTAILVGDLLVSVGFKKANSVSPQLSISLVDCIEAMTKGAILEENFKYKIIDERIYMEIAALKTASLFRWIALCIAMISKSNFFNECSKISENFGIAFQIIDDVLDVEGDDSFIGKESFKDLYEGKINYPMLMAIDEDYVKKRIDYFFADKTDLTPLYEIKKYLIEKKYVVAARERALSLIDKVKHETLALGDGENVVDFYAFMRSMTLRRN